jgi:formate dehydrogenase subunit delta
MSGAEAGHDGHITTSTSERLVYMANQIAQFFGSQRHDAAVAGIADHIGKFWDPRMRSQIFAHLDAGGEGLKAEAAEALAVLRDGTKVAST